MFRRACPLVLFAGFLACGGDGGDAEPMDEPVPPGARITSPADGATVGASVTVTLASDGIAIVPAGTMEPNSGHYHLFLDRDIGAFGEVIPNDEGIVHLGLAQTEYTYEGLAPGSHLVVVGLGDHQHVLMAGVATDTVRFTVQP